MEIQFQKTAVPYLRTSVHRSQSQEQAQQVRISDGMPDVGKVLASWGQVLLRGKQWLSDSFSVSGGVKAWVLYAPEDGSRPRMVESWLPFQMKWDMPEAMQDGSIIACPMMPAVDARMLSDRKLMVRANINVDAWALVPMEAMVFIPGDLPQDMQMLKNTYPMLLPAEAGEKAFELDEAINLPGTEQPIDTLLRYTLEPKLTESKTVADKLVFRGVAILQLLYLGTDGAVHTWKTELPFSQYTQLEGQYASDAETQFCFAVTSLEIELGETGNLTLKAGIIAQFVMWDRKEFEIVEDMYSPNRPVKPMYEQLQLPVMLERQEHTLRMEGTAEDLPGGILDVQFIPETPLLRREEDKVIMDLSGAFQFLGTDAEGELSGYHSRWEDSWEFPAGEDTELWGQVKLAEMPQVAGTDARGELQLSTVAMGGQPIDMVMGVETGELSEPDPNRPSLILRRAGEDSLWTLAKENGSTVESIRKLNNLQQEPNREQMLIIPIL